MRLTMAVRILVVEGDHRMREFIWQILTNDGFTVETVHSAVQGIRALELAAFQIVIADYYLPGMLGDEFLGVGCQHWPWIRRVMLSGLHAAEIPPGTATLQHPINESELIKLVRSLVNELEKSQGDTGG